MHALNDEKLSKAANIAEQSFLMGRQVLSRLSIAMQPESERITSKIGKGEKLAVPVIDTNTFIVDIQRAREASLNSKDINAIKIAIVPLLDAVFKASNDEGHAFAKIEKVTSDILNSNSIGKSEYIFRLNIVTSTISEYLMSRYTYESDLIEYMARLCNALSKSAIDNASKAKVSRTELVRNIAHAVSSPWMESATRPIESKNSNR